MGLKDDLSKGYEEKKAAVGKEISETKAEISESIDKGVKKTKSFLWKLMMFLLVTTIVAGIGYLLYASYTFSEGTRTGTLVKISKKGMVLKTYEGQLNVGGISTSNDGTISNMWNFSVKDERVFQKLQTMEGKEVTLHYDEIIQAMPWQGDTNYFIEMVEEVKR